MWLHEALLAPVVTEFLPEATVDAWRCRHCGHGNVTIDRPASVERRCDSCGRIGVPPQGRLTVTKVDHEKKTITISGVP